LRWQRATQKAGADKRRAFTPELHEGRNYMKKRRKMSKYKSKKLFKKTVNKMNTRNISRPKRGGGRL
jgi:hypothetical protein